MSSLITLSDVKTYISNNKFNTTNWDALTDAQKQKAINEAENSILSIPFIDVYYLETGTITQAIKNAICEETYSFVENQNLIQHLNAQNAGIKSQSLDNYSVTYDNTLKKELNSSIAANLLKPYVQRIFDL